jgi:hypothetical protein
MPANTDPDGETELAVEDVSQVTQAGGVVEPLAADCPAGRVD